MPRARTQSGSASWALTVSELATEIQAAPAMNMHGAADQAFGATATSAVDPALSSVPYSTSASRLTTARSRDSPSPATIAPKPMLAKSSVKVPAPPPSSRLAISGSNVKIPAHYHGSIVGVTLAFMGLVYYLLPRMGFGRPQGRLARLQPALYGGGQLLHIAGLLWSGGYGVQRKVAGGEQLLRTPEQVAGMGLMGLGGLLAVAGGVAFALVVLRSLWTSSTSRS